MSLIDLIQGKYNLISIVGMAKNAGKTVTLNHLIQGAMDQGITLGLTSIGRDGEPLDIVTSTPKPLIYVTPGTVIATAKASISKGDCLLEIIAGTGIFTALGEIMIGRVRDGGHVEIAGPDNNSDLKRVTNLLLDMGVQLVLVDGAIDRVAAASPSVTQGCILATGAVLSRSIDKVVEQTLHRVALFSLETLEDDRKQLCLGAMEQSSVSIVDKDGNINALNIKTALGSGAIIAQAINDNSKYIVIKGSLTKSTLDSLLSTLRKYKDVEIIVYDGTKIFIEAMDWQFFIRAGVRVRVVEAIRVLAVTLNPYSPEGYYFDSHQLKARMEEALHPIRVVDVMGAPGV